MRGILPALRQEMAEFWAYAQRREFRAQRCADCGGFRWPPSPACAACWSFAATWEPLGGRGLLRSWVTFRRQYFSEFAVPYTVGLVELPEGLRYPALLLTGAQTPPWRYEQPLAVTFMEFEAESGARMLLPVFETVAA